jgi:lipopolysaccharide transport system ATP-binding protein
MSAPIIEVQGLGKTYQLGTIGPTSFKEMFRWSREKKRASAQAREFRALHDVSFTVNEGDVVGIIGRNGAGKSTLLKILSRITEPTAGRALLRGRVASLLEVGTGFHPDLTGRENVYLNGAILGMRRAEIRRKFDEIVAFSGVEKFIDTPVKRYSSGMYVRLAFAVAAHLEQEILIVDEVLAVGDAAFQAKCLGKMQNVAAEEGRTILFISHNMQAVMSLCTHAVRLAGGTVAGIGTPGDMVSAYLEAMSGGALMTEWNGHLGNETLTLHHARIQSAAGGFLATHEPITLQLRATLHAPVTGLFFAVEVWNQSEQQLAYSGYDDAQPPPATPVEPGQFIWQVTIPGNSLTSGIYEFRFDIGVYNVGWIIKSADLRLGIHLENIAGIGRRFVSDRTPQLFRLPWQWERIPVGGQ